MSKEERYDDYLDEVYNYYEIEGVILRPSTILKEADPIAYRVGLADFEDDEDDNEEE